MYSSITNCNYCCGTCLGRSRRWPSRSAAMTPHPACLAALTRRKTTSAGVPRKDELTLQDRIVHLKWVMSGGTDVLPFTVFDLPMGIPHPARTYSCKKTSGFCGGYTCCFLFYFCGQLVPCIVQDFVWLWCPLFGSPSGTHSISGQRKKKRFPRA
jgi:hypothetical protein